jgi:hypothetical protein
VGAREGSRHYARENNGGRKAAVVLGACLGRCGVKVADLLVAAFQLASHFFSFASGLGRE